jgi:hypothetical protein
VLNRLSLMAPAPAGFLFSHQPGSNFFLATPACGRNFVVEVLNNLEDAMPINKISTGTRTVQIVLQYRQQEMAGLQSMLNVALDCLNHVIRIFHP